MGGIFQTLASWAQLNVSATHSIVGGIIGFALVHAGSNGVLWDVASPNAFPPYAGVVPIVVSWFFSPIFSGVASYLIFVTVRTFVLRSSEPVKRSYYVLPLLIFLTIWINTYFVLIKGAKAQLSDAEWDTNKSAWVAAVVAAGCMLLSLLAIPYITVRVEERLNRLEREKEDRDNLREDLEYARIQNGSMAINPYLVSAS